MHDVFSWEFWENVARKALAWSADALPSILFILALVFILLRLLKPMQRRITSVLVARIEARGGIKSAEQSKRVETLAGIAASFIRLAIWISAGLLLVRQLGIDIAPVLAGAGIIGLALGFGAQELLRDMVSGFFMLIENQVRTGDIAVVNGTGGLVERIGFRTIVLRDLSGVVHVFQNGKINTLANMTKDWSAMVFDIGVSYKENPDRVMRVMTEAAEELRRDPGFGLDILEEVEVFGVEAFAESAVMIRARLKTKPIRQWDVGREYRRRLKLAFDKEGIQIPFPHLSLDWGKPSGQGNGARDGHGGE